MSDSDHSSTAAANNLCDLSIDLITSDYRGNHDADARVAIDSRSLPSRTIDALRDLAFSLLMTGGEPRRYGHIEIRVALPAEIETGPLSELPWGWRP